MFRWGPNKGFPCPEFGSAFKAPTCTTAVDPQEKARLGQTDHSDRIVTGEEIDKLVNASHPNMAAMVLLGQLRPRPGRSGPAPLEARGPRDRRLNYPRHKTGADRRGYIWKRTREALDEWGRLKHAIAAIAKDGLEALVFVTRRGGSRTARK
jgi:hypothetical protein